MCRQAKETALFTLKLSIVLLICLIMLHLGPEGYDTYYNLQVIRAMPEVIFAVLMAGGIGSAWMQYLHTKNNSR